jgi:hypothetical protein
MNIDSIQGKIREYLAVIEAWLWVITPYKYIF